MRRGSVNFVATFGGWSRHATNGKVATPPRTVYVQRIMNIKSPIIALAGACLLVSANCPAATGDWPQWRGPNRDGISTEKGLLKQWPAGGPALVWTATGLGVGYSGLTMAGNRIYTVGDSAGGNNVIALNRADGKILWTAKLGKPGAPGWGGFAGPRSSVTIDGDHVYALGQYGELACLSAADGKEIWRKNLVSDLGGSLMEWGFSESPLVDGDLVLVTPGGEQGTLAALDKKTGEVRWRSTEWKDGAHYSSIIIANLCGMRQYVQLTDKSVAGVSPADGKLLWKAARKGATAVIPTPIAADDHVYVTSGYGAGCNVFKISKDGDSFKAEQVYANKVMVNHHGGAVKIGDNVYGHSDGKGWTCQNFKTGEAVWQEKEKLKKGSIAFADGLLFCREEADKKKSVKCTIALLEATPGGYKELGRFDQPNRSDMNSWTHPVIAGGKLYIRDQDVLLCYDVQAK